MTICNVKKMQIRRQVCSQHRVWLQGWLVDPIWPSFAPWAVFEHLVPPYFGFICMFCLQGCCRPQYEVRNWLLHFLFLISAGLGHEVFYITCLPCIHWSLDPFLCRRLVNMWTVSHCSRQNVCVDMRDHLCSRKHKSWVWCPFVPQYHLSSLCSSSPLSSPFNLLSSPSPTSDLSLTPPCPHIPRPGGHWGQPDQGPWHGERPHMGTHHRKKTARLSSLDVYPHWNQQIATRGPENMSDVIPEAVYLTLVETQTAIPPLSCTVCVSGSVFLCPLCPCPERLVGALCLNPLFGPWGERDTILLASWLHQAPVWTPFIHT